MRIMKDGHDRRFNNVRDSPGTFFVYWTVQGTWSDVNSSLSLPTLHPSELKDAPHISLSSYYLSVFIYSRPSFCLQWHKCIYFKEGLKRSWLDNDLFVFSSLSHVGIYDPPAHPHAEQWEAWYASGGEGLHWLDCLGPWLRYRGNCWPAKVVFQAWSR